MTKLAILSPKERTQFDNPPIFNAEERTIFFSLTNSLLKTVEQLRTNTNKAGFMLQLGYFKANGKFFTAEQFRQKDIEYVIKILDLNINKINLSKYQKKYLKIIGKKF